ncbi:hypothetical protein, partial [Nodularia chucula]|uniref:hypothetical protein n=1 Tax=Nodularia chucula TaxID=3093667 RepID=UPI0039C65807
HNARVLAPCGIPRCGVGAIGYLKIQLALLLHIQISYVNISLWIFGYAIIGSKKILCRIVTMARTGRPKGRETKGVSLKVNPDAWELFQELAQGLGLTRSELVEKIATEQIPLSLEDSQLKDSLGNSLAS